MSYFKNTNPEALDAWEAQEQGKAKLRDESESFAAEFDGKAILSSSADSHSFCGVKLNNYHARPDNILWTSPDRSSGVSRPRSTLKKRPEWTKDQFVEFKRQLEQLEQRYKAAQWPARIDREPFWNAIGTSWGELLFAGISAFEYAGALFIKTGLKLEGCSEILGSEYDAAWSSRQAANKEAA